MNGITLSSDDWRKTWKRSTFAVLLLVLTSVHHAYGAIVYQTPWRLHVVAVALPIAAAILLMAQSERRAWQISAAVLIMIVPVLLIGLFEGGYNHVAKNLVFVTAGAARTRAMFPPPLYELPGDYFFEGTGIAQFFVAPFAALESLRLFFGERAETAR